MYISKDNFNFHKYSQMKMCYCTSSTNILWEDSFLPYFQGNKAFLISLLLFH